MIFRDWLKELDYTLLQGSVDVETEDVIYDSRKAAPGKAFVAMKGIRVDGHSFIPQVLKAGVRVLVTERPVEEELKNSGLSEEELKQVTVVMVEEGRHALALLSAARFDHPAKKLVMIGVTGTKGKTTTTHMIRAILLAAGKKVGMIGTTGTTDNVEVGSSTLPGTTNGIKFGGLAQLARASALHAEGQRFESVILHSIGNVRNEDERSMTYCTSKQ